MPVIFGRRPAACPRVEAASTRIRQKGRCFITLPPQQKRLFQWSEAIVAYRMRTSLSRLLRAHRFRPSALAYAREPDRVRFAEFHHWAPTAPVELPAWRVRAACDHEPDWQFGTWAILPGACPGIPPVREVRGPIRRFGSHRWYEPWHPDGVLPVRRSCRRSSGYNTTWPHRGQCAPAADGAEPDQSARHAQSP